jgi:Tol biopolymer transport system component
MPAPSRRRSTAAAIALTAGLTAGAALLLSACGPGDPAAGGSTPTATGGSRDGTGDPTPTATARPVTSREPLNGTARGGLTVSDGTRYVVMNGTRVDFGTLVRDLAWSPDGRKAAFVDGDGDLAVSDPDGSGRVVVAKNPGGQTWSHPTWALRKADPADGLTALDDLLFAVRAGGTTKLYGVPVSGGAPTVLGLNSLPGRDTTQLPQTGNTWPSAGSNGTSVYANSDTGQVYLRDDNIRQQGSALTAGSEPAISPALTGDGGEDIVFVRSVAGHDHLVREHSTNSGPVYDDLTPHATTDYTEPAFSPDGRQIAARTPDGIVELPADGSGSPVRVSGTKGLPAFRAS